LRFKTLKRVEHPFIPEKKKLNAQVNAGEGKNRQQGRKQNPTKDPQGNTGGNRKKQKQNFIKILIPPLPHPHFSEIEFATKFRGNKEFSRIF